MPKRKATPKKRVVQDGAATSDSLPLTVNESAESSTEHNYSKEAESAMSKKRKAASKKAVESSPKLRSSKKAKPSIKHVPDYPDDLYEPEGIYCDLGYLIFDEEIVSLTKDTWKAKVYAFNITLDIQQLQDSLPRNQSMEECLIELRKMQHCRVVWRNPENSQEQADAVEDSGVLFHLPYEVAQASVLPLVLQGSVTFPDMPPAGRPGGWTLWDVSQYLHQPNSVFPLDAVNAVRHVDALRYFMMPSIGAQEKDNVRYNIPLSPLPICDTVGRWECRGQSTEEGLPKRLELKTDSSQQMVFLASFDDRFEETGKILVEGYIRDTTDTEKFLEGFAQEYATMNPQTLKTGKRFKFLMDSLSKSSLKDNSFLENLVVEKNYEPVRIVNRKDKAIGQNVGLETLNQLFDFVKTCHADQRVSETHNPQHKNLKLQMHAYQQRAASWMVEKELAVVENVDHPHPLYFAIQTADHKEVYMHYSSGRISRTMPLVKTPRGGILADEMGLGKTLEILSLILVNSKENSQPHFPDQFWSSSRHPVEQGVFQCYCFPSQDSSKKKLQEMISCVKCGATVHADCVNADMIPEDQVYLCSTCQRDDRIECRTTLVVAPGAIIPQWKSEIAKATKNLKVYEYQGLKKAGHVSPWEIGSYDIVLASYEMLAKELLYVFAEQRKASLRTRAVKQHYSSPLLSIKFWRLVLDEAQMVESEASNFAVMAMKIKAEFYWAVTGTPVTRTVWDIQSLLRFIEFEPWDNARGFEEYIAGPFQAKIFSPLQNLLSDCMWRLEKRDVEAEMDLPPCSMVVHSVALTGIEQQMYGQVYRDCIKMIASNLKGNKTLGRASFETQFTSLDGSVVRTVKDWMARLAKLCASPTRVSYFFRMAKRSKKVEAEDEGADSLTRVLKTLLEKAKGSLIGSLRACIMDNNALAAYYWLQEAYSDAADQYRAAKRLWHENEALVPVDLLQKLHILSNLGQLLADHGDAIVGRSLEDDQLLAQAEALRVEFMTRKGADRVSSIEKLQTTWDMPHTQKDLDKRILPVYSVLRLVGRDQVTSLINDVKLANIAGTSMRNSSSTNTYIRSRALSATYVSIEGLKFSLQSRWDEILTEREDIGKSMKDLIRSSAPEMEQFPLDCAVCHLRSVGTFRDKCLLCKAEKKFGPYEDLIFRTEQLADEDDDVITSVAYRKRRRFDKSEDDDSRLTTYHDSDFETACKAVMVFVKTHSGSSGAFKGLEKDLDKFLTVLASIKREFKLWKEVWSAVYDYTASVDEIKQALMRVRFQSEDEMNVRKALKAGAERKKMDVLLTATIPRGESVLPRIHGAKVALKANMQEMSRDATHFKYIRNMHEGYTQHDEVKTRDCCVCFDPVGEQWALFPCAHVMCEGCLKTMTELVRVEIYHHSTMQCPLCRSSANMREIVRASGISNISSNALITTQRRFNAENLRGAPSKVEAVVKKVFELIEKEPDVKILIFSNYPDVLEDYHNTLVRNGVQSHLVKAKGTIPASMTLLRSGNVRTMLMPINLGGKGLTIIEASHVFFLEALLNMGVELQAIGRIHRMGQTKQTFVHKFIVSGTVEERIHHLMESVGEEGSLLQKDLTLGQVLELLKSGDVHGPDMDDLNQWIEGTRSADSSMVIEDQQPQTGVTTD